MNIKWYWLCILLGVASFISAGCSEESAQSEPTSSTQDDGFGDVTHDTGSSADDGAGLRDETSERCGDGLLDDDEECDEGDSNSDTLADACRTNCRVASCGDGVVDLRLNETCDDGNTVDDDGCNNLCRLSSCGDGVLQTGEACDDGPDNSDTRPDTCRANCTQARCGDAVTDTDEACDDGNDLNHDACLGCVIARCGDGFIRQNVETCDDQNGAALDGCSDLCRVELGFSCQGEPSVCTTTCGDGVIGGLETCDDQNTQNGDYCASDCAAITGRCGDNIIQTNEACDDGNTQNGDDCAANCQTISGFCGDGQVQSNEVCDDSNTQNGDYCAADCQSITGRCGDDIQQSNETCDDGNTLSGDYCSANCAQITGFCGDGTLQSNETCDDANTNTNDYCAPTCQTITGRCGDGIVQSNEQCDDANSTAGDYCSSACAITGSCGDGSVQILAGEACDDGNSASNDGCLGTCTAIEPGWSCFGTPTSCTQIRCDADQHVQDNVCVACPAGSTNTAGDSAADANTLCDPTLCAEHQRVESNACVPCLAGTENLAGDDASGADTSCDPVFCAANEYVVGNACVPCPAGTTNVAGDDAAGPDTACDPTLCAENQRVQNHLCVMCSVGMANAAGDDASGDDTTCEEDPCYLVLGVLCIDFEQAYIKASNTGTSDAFGVSIALSGDTLAVGAYLEDSLATGVNGNQSNDSASGSGAVYIFTRSGTTWTQQAYIKASNAGTGDQFGFAVALSGDTLAVGAPHEDSNAIGVNGSQLNDGSFDSGAVYVFTRSGTDWTQTAYIKASNAEPDDYFGESIALDADTLAVGAQMEDSAATGIGGNQASNAASGSGAVYVFTRSGADWTQEAYIKASNTDTNDRFGVAMALSADTLAVSAYWEDSAATGINGNQADNAATNSGAVYVFSRSGTTWAQTAYLKASNTGANDFFGNAVALDADTLAVGAHLEDSAATGINGNQADNSATDSGAVYIFTRSGTDWTQEAYLKASNTEGGDQFGKQITLSSDTIAVGAYLEDSGAMGVNGDPANNTTTDSGAVYIFNRAGIDWTQQAYIKASNTNANDYFGNVVLSGDTLAIAASGEDSNATGVGGDQTNNAALGSGAVYVRHIRHTFCATNEHVQNNACVPCPPGTLNAAGDDSFRSDTTCDNDPCYLVLGVLCADFTQAYLKASNPGTSDYFGHFVALSGDTLAVGALSEDSSATGMNGDQTNNAAIDSGAVYIFVRSGTTWTQQAYIKASNTEASDNFGVSIALDGDTLAVGAEREDSNATGTNGDQTNNAAINSGAVYIFTRSGTDWTQTAYIKASNTGGADVFGRKVALSGDTLAVGADGEDSNARGVNGNQADNSAAASGAVYVFTRSGTDWTQQAYIKASNAEAGDRFGEAIALSGDTLAVGAFNEASAATGINGNQADNTFTESGAAYVFVRSGTTWTQQAYIKASNAEAYDNFGSAVALDGDTLAVSAPLENSAVTGVNGNQANNLGTDSGAVYVFTRSGSSWTQQAYIKASNTNASDSFGSDLTLLGDTLAVSAYREDSYAINLNGDQTNNFGTDSGAVYLFTRTGTDWTQQAYIKASNTNVNHWFGGSIALSGDTLAVGAMRENSLALESGAVYVRKIKP